MQMKDENSEVGQRNEAQKAQLQTISVFSSSRPLGNKGFESPKPFTGTTRSEFTAEFLCERKTEPSTLI